MNMVHPFQIAYKSTNMTPSLKKHDSLQPLGGFN